MKVDQNPLLGFWRGKRVLITGHTGFKGSWLSLWLHSLGAKVTGISLPPATTPNLFSIAKIEALCQNHFCDIREADSLAGLISTEAPDIVFHLAAQALVRPGYREPLATFATNTLGTANVLEGLRHIESIRAVVAVTTDKVYANETPRRPHQETDRLGGHDPYSASKAASEIVIRCYRDSYFLERGVAIASARAGNVVAGGDWSEDRLIPDAVRAWGNHQPLSIRNPHAVRPWQHVLEPLNGYIKLAEHLWSYPEFAGAYNFGPQPNETATVRQVVQLAQTAFGGGEVIWADGNGEPQEADWLALEIDKAKTVLGINPRWSLSCAVKRTMHWYEAYSHGENARVLCEADIVAYTAASEGFDL